MPGWALLPVIVKTGDDLRQELLAYQLLRTLDVGVFTTYISFSSSKFESKLALTAVTLFSRKSAK